MTRARATLLSALTAVLVGAVAVTATTQTPQKAPPTPAQALLRTLSSLNQRIVAMAEYWPEEKYGFRLDEKPTRRYARLARSWSTSWTATSTLRSEAAARRRTGTRSTRRR